MCMIKEMVENEFGKGNQKDRQKLILQNLIEQVFIGSN